MADVRSLLRNELAARKGASPNTSGNRVSKKRKVDNGDGVMRKKLRSTDLEAVQAAADGQGRPPLTSAETNGEGLELIEEDEVAGPEPLLEEEHESNVSMVQPSAPPQPATAPSQAAPGTVDEDEWAAFERDVVAPTRMPQAPAAVAAGATISAAPVSAEELAAQQERQTAMTAKAREAELEGEREEAARFMEEEFDEMDQLEERVRRLKRMREELRQKRTEDQARNIQATSEDQQVAESENESDEDEDWDDWRFK